MIWYGMEWWYLWQPRHTNIAKQIGRYHPSTLLQAAQVVCDPNERSRHNGDLKVGEKEGKAYPAYTQSEQL
jgi:hypothetical protein